MPLVDLVMPKLGESIMEATILKWYKQVGDTIHLDETLLDIATDKVDSEVPSTVGGIIKEILFEVNAVVPIGAVIARIESAGTNAAPTSTTTVTEPIAPIVAKPSETIVQEVPFTPTPTTQTATASPIAIPIAQAKNNTDSVQNSDGSDPKFFSPLVLSIAQSEGVSFNELQYILGTGSLGRVSKKDILNYIAAKKAGTLAPIAQAPTSIPTSTSTNNSIPVAPTQTSTPSKPLDELLSDHSNFMAQSSSAKVANPEEVILTGNTEIVEMDRMRKLIAKHMVDSVQTSPHVTSFVEADVTNMVVWREKVKQLFEKREGTKLTFTPMFFECIAAALEKYPIVNSSLQNDQIIYRKDINIGMATALPTGNLIVPVIKGANQLSIVGLSKAVNNLANAARNNQLRPQDTQGGTFTVTNVGTFGSLMGTPIINQPQVAVLALGAIKKRAVVVETPQGDAITVRHMMYLSMSYDHRIVDGAVGSQFLTAVAKAFENWDPNRQWFQYV
jgi:2-oxoglutarate dehydrogenase E2 component (dihydrolipoamide succinyltransferase)